MEQSRIVRVTMDEVLLRRLQRWARWNHLIVTNVPDESPDEYIMVISPDHPVHPARERS